MTYYDAGVKTVNDLALRESLSKHVYSILSMIETTPRGNFDAKPDETRQRK